MNSKPWRPMDDGDGAHIRNGSAAGEQLSMIKLLNILLKRRSLILTTTGLAMFATVLAMLATPRTYSSAVSFVPQERTASIVDLAGFVPPPGFSLPGSSNQSSAFYADLLQSEELLRGVVTATYQTGEDQTTANNLITAFGIESDDEGVAVEHAVEQLRKRITVRTDRETGVIRYVVSTRSPELSLEVAEKLLEMINTFDLNRRQSQASAERQFLAARLDSVRMDVRAAETGLERFLERNRTFRNSPKLVFEHDRLERNVLLNQQLLVSLSEAFERARIEEVRNTPVLTVIDHARARRLPDSRQLPIKTLVAMLAGIVIGIGAALWMEFLAQSKRAEPEAYDEFLSLRHDTFSTVRALLPRKGKDTMKTAGEP